MAKITISQSAIDEIPQVKDLALQAVLKGVDPVTVGDNVEYEVTADRLSLDVAKFIVSVDGTVENYPLFIEINSENDLVPDSLFGAIQTDEEGNETNLTWSEWKRDNHTFLTIGDRLFIGANAHTSEDPELSQLLPVYDSLLTNKEIKDLQSNQPVEL